MSLKDLQGRWCIEVAKDQRLYITSVAEMKERTVGRGVLDSQIEMSYREDSPIAVISSVEDFEIFFKLEEPIRWMLIKEDKRCTDFNCDKYDLAQWRSRDTKVTVTSFGLVTIECRHCERTGHRQLSTYRERKVCENHKCGWGRDILVKWGHWNRLCDACKLERAARTHEHKAAGLQAKVAEIRLKRSGRVRLKSVAAEKRT
jgi:hypothetical protein